MRSERCATSSARSRSPGSPSASRGRRARRCTTSSEGFGESILPTGRIPARGQDGGGQAPPGRDLRTRLYPAAVSSPRLGTPVVALFVSASALLAPAAAGAKVTLHTTPAITPRFGLSVPDYVSRCATNKPLRFTVDASKGDTVAIG